MSAVDSVKARIEQRPKQAVIISAVVGLVVGAVIGLGIGYKVEHDRVSKKASTPATKTTTPKTPKTTKSGTKTGIVTRGEGKVTATASGSITLQTVKGVTEHLTVSGDTTFDRATAGARSDVTAGRNVFVKAPGAEVLVLRSGAKQGRAVTSISPTALVVVAGKGLPAGTIKLSSTTLFDKVSPATAADVKVGDRIIALGSGTAAAFKVDSVIILPATSKFAS
jgi:hypothetical protein